MVKLPTPKQSAGVADVAVRNVLSRAKLGQIHCPHGGWPKQVLFASAAAPKLVRAAAAALPVPLSVAPRFLGFRTARLRQVCVLPAFPAADRDGRGRATRPARTQRGTGSAARPPGG